jgi:hypothetical protein
MPATFDTLILLEKEIAFEIFEMSKLVDRGTKHAFASLPFGERIEKRRADRSRA